MKIVKLLFCLFLPLFSFAQQEPIKEYFLMRFEKEGKIVDDTLWVACSNPECTFYLGKDSIGPAWAYVSSPSLMVSRLSAASYLYNNVFLLQTHAGDGCPTLYQILEFSRDGKPSFGEQFGNCNEAEKITIKGNTIQFDFPGMKDPKRPKVSHKVLIKN
jgi:hypothetical protein